MLVVSIIREHPLSPRDRGQRAQNQNGLCSRSRKAVSSLTNLAEDTGYGGFYLAGRWTSPALLPAHQPADRLATMGTRLRAMR